MSEFKMSVEDSLTAIAAGNPQLNAFITVCAERAREQVKKAPKGILHRVPFGLKDQYDVAGLVTTQGSHRFRDKVATEDSAVYRALSGAGAVLMGKTNLSDHGISFEASSYVGGPTRNPFDPRRTAGGSSGGSASAVAAGLVDFDWGSDIGGSIRLPAAYCGVFGMRLSSETWPVVDMVMPEGLRWMCGQGPLTRELSQMKTVLKAARALRIGAQRPFTLRGARAWSPAVAGEWPTFATEVLPLLRELGDALPETALPDTTTLRNLYSWVWASHFDDLLAHNSDMSAIDGIVAAVSAVVFRGKFGDRRFYPLTAEILLLMAAGRLSIYRGPAKARAKAHAFRARMQGLWDQGLVVVQPVSVFSPPFIGKSNRNTNALSCTIPGNLSDATGLSMPFGTFANGMPRAIQLLGPPGSEDVLIAMAEKLLALPKYPALPVPAMRFGARAAA